jgi:hypothetical protein
MKTYGGLDVWTNISLTSALVGGKWSASRLSRFTHGERAPHPQYPLDRMGEHQRQSGQHGEMKILHPSRTQTLISQSSSQ